METTTLHEGYVGVIRGNGKEHGNYSLATKWSEPRTCTRARNQLLLFALLASLVLKRAAISSFLSPGGFRV